MISVHQSYKREVRTDLEAKTDGRGSPWTGFEAATRDSISTPFKQAVYIPEEIANEKSVIKWISS